MSRCSTSRRSVGTRSWSSRVPTLILRSCPEAVSTRTRGADGRAAQSTRISSSPPGILP